MENIIILSSDDDDSTLAPSLRTRNIKDEMLLSHDTNFEDKEEFDYGTNMVVDSYLLEFEGGPSTSSGQFCEGLNSLPEISNSLKTKPVRVVHDLSDSDDPEEGVKLNQYKAISSSDDELPDININLAPSYKLNKENKISQYMNKELTRGQSPQPIQAKSNKCEEQHMRKRLEQAERAKQKQAVQVEREKKKKEAAHLKALKQATCEIERAKKPGECLKWITAVLDTGLLNSDYSGELITALRSSELEYKVEECIIPCTVSWERRIQTVEVDNDMIQKKTTVKNETSVLVMWMWNKLIEQVHMNSLQTAIEEIHSLLPDRDLTLVIYGLEEYFRFQKTQKRRNVRSEVLGSGPQKQRVKEGSIDAAPQVSRGDVEYALAEIQVNCNISHRCINNKTDMANLVCQFTKAIAEAPFKREKHQKDAERLDWYALADSKDCVVVDKDGNGSFQLWQRQLCQFPLASRETSEAIASVYPSPMSLLQAYENCSSEDTAQCLLEDIPVRRGPGPLSTTRRIGPQLSKKIYTFFTTIDEDCLIAPD